MDLKRSLMHLVSGFLRWSMEGSCAPEFQLNCRMDLERSLMHLVSGLLRRMGLCAIIPVELKDGFGSFSDPSDLAAVESSQRHASTTVMHTFLVMSSLDKIPSIASIAGRKKACQDLKDRVGIKLFKLGTKQSTISKSVIARISSLSEGTAYERLDFERIKKDKDAAKSKAEGSKSDEKQS